MNKSIYNFTSPQTGLIRLPEKNLLIGDSLGIGRASPGIELDNLPTLGFNNIIVGSRIGNIESSVLDDFRYDLLYSIALGKKIAASLDFLAGKRVFLDGPDQRQTFNIGGQSFDFFKGCVDANTVFSTKATTDAISSALDKIEKIMAALALAGVVTQGVMQGWGGIDLSAIARQLIDGTVIQRGLLLIERVQGLPVFNIAAPFNEYVPVNDAEYEDEPIEMGENEEDLLLGYGSDLEASLDATKVIRKAKLYSQINRNLLPNLTSGKIWIGDGTNRPVEADQCCDDFEDASFLVNDYTAKQKRALPNLVSIKELSGGWSGYLKVDSGSVSFSSEFSELFRTLAISAGTSIVTVVGWDIFKSLFVPELAAASFVFDIARVVAKVVDPEHPDFGKYQFFGETHHPEKNAPGKAFSASPPKMTGFRDGHTNTTDMVATIGVLRATQILVGKDRDGTNMLGYTSPIRGRGYLELPQFNDDSWWSAFSNWWWGDQTPPAAQLNLEFVPQMDVDFNTYGSTNLSKIQISSEFETIQTPTEGTVGKDSDSLTVYHSGAWGKLATKTYVDASSSSMALKEWTTATRPVTTELVFGVNSEVITPTPPGP